MSEEKDHKAQPHEGTTIAYVEDDCEDCQRERAENNQLINIYERLNKMKAKVHNIKPQLSNYSINCKENESKLLNISQRIEKVPNIDLSQVNEKQMGYELAYALIEREMKMKRENQVLAKKIKDLKESQQKMAIRNESKFENEEEKHQILKEQRGLTFSNNHYNDSLDDFKEHKNDFWLQQPPSRPMREKNKSQISKYSNSFVITGENSSTISSFQEKEAVTDPKRYSDLNLWLYQLQPEENEKSAYKTSNKRKGKFLS